VASPPVRPIEGRCGFPACHHGRADTPELRESPRLLRGHPHTYRAIASGVAGTGRLLDRREGGKDREPPMECLA